MQSRLLDHHHRLQLITNPRPYQPSAIFIPQGMQRAEVMDQLVEAGVLSPAMADHQGELMTTMDPDGGRVQWHRMPAAPVHHAVDIPGVNRFAAAGIRPT